MSSAMMSLKMLSSLTNNHHPLNNHPLNTMGGLFPSSSSLHGSSPSLTPPGHPRSVLSAENQRALARRGYYGDHLPEGVDPRDLQGSRREESEDADRKSSSAEDKRKQFHKTKSRRQRSLVEECGDEDDSPYRRLRHDSTMKSVDFSTTTESTDSGELSTSAPNTPGDVFLDHRRTPSPSLLGAGVGGIGVIGGGVGGGAPAFPVDRLENIDDLYLPDNKGASSCNLTVSRQQLTDLLMSDPDRHSDYFVSPVNSRQPTVEKAATLTDVQAEVLERDLDSSSGGGGGDGSPRRRGSSRGRGGGDDEGGRRRGSGRDRGGDDEGGHRRGGSSARDRGDRRRGGGGRDGSDRSDSVFVDDEEEGSVGIVVPSSSASSTCSSTANNNSNNNKYGDDRNVIDTGSYRTGNIKFDQNTKSVTIVVSDDGRKKRGASQQQQQQQPQPSSSPSGRGFSFSGTGGGGGHDGASGGGGPGMNFLSIVHAAVDKMSDSGSDHTLVDHHSSSSGSSPRPHPRGGTGVVVSSSEVVSPRIVTWAEGVRASPPRESEHWVSRLEDSGGGGVRSEYIAESGGVAGSGSTRRVPQGPVLVVYHKTNGANGSPRDENDNVPLTAQGNNVHHHRHPQQNIDDDLPRMSSIQSDSSGFGDTEVTGDNPLTEMAHLKVGSLGSSCESSTTMASTCTVTGDNNANPHFNNSFHNISTGAAQAPTRLHQGSDEDQQRRLSQSMDDLRSDSPSSNSGSGRRYVTTCFIPNLNNARRGSALQPSTHRGAPPSSTSPPPPFILAGSSCSNNSNSSRSSRSSGGNRTSSTSASVSASAGANKTQVSTLWREKDRAGRWHAGEGGRGGGGGQQGRNNETPLSEELALAFHSPRPDSSSSSSLHGSAVQASSTPRYLVQQQGGGGRGGGGGGDPTAMPRLLLRKPTQDSSSVEGSRGEGSTGDELESGGEDRALTYSSWSRELPPTSTTTTTTRTVPSSRSVGSAGGSRPARHSYPNVLEMLDDGGGGDGGSGASLEGSSVYSCASTSDSIASSSGSELLDCQKLMRLINRPTLFKGRRTHLVHYRPKRHLRDWPALLKKKKLQEETRLAQSAMQKFKTELSIMETSVMVKYQTVFEDMSKEERDDVEELQHLWAEVRRQVMETEHLLTSRMKSVAAGNDNFTPLTHISVLQRMIDLLKEQLFQKQVAMLDDDDDDDVDEAGEEEDWEARDRRRMQRHGWGGGGGGGGQYRGDRDSRGFAPRFSAGSWSDLPRGPRSRGRHSVSYSHLPASPLSDASFQQMKTSLLSEVRQELSSSLQTLQQDLHKRDSEIHRLQLQLMLEKRNKKPKSSTYSTRSLGRPRRDAKETDV